MKSLSRNIYKSFLMLHAIEKKKTTYYRRYVGHRDGYEKKVCEEDEITSTVFGPLELLDTASVHQFWTDVIQSKGNASVLPKQPPTRHQLNFWPKNRNVEPDVHLTFFYPDDSRLDILIEVKWHAPLSGKDQLRIQWLTYLDKDIRKNCWHVFIAPEVSVGLTAGNATAIWNIGGDERLILFSWAHIKEVLLKYQDRSNSLARWAALTNHFLERIGIRRFNGFANAKFELPYEEVLLCWSFKGSSERFTGFGAAAPELPAAWGGFESFFKE